MFFYLNYYKYDQIFREILGSNFNRLNVSYVQLERTFEGDFLSVNLHVGYLTNGLNASEDLIPKIESFNIEQRFSSLAENTNLRYFVYVQNQTCQDSSIESNSYIKFL